MVAIPRPWYNAIYTMAAEPIKTLELHYSMITSVINILNGQSIIRSLDFYAN